LAAPPRFRRLRLSHRTEWRLARYWVAGFEPRVALSPKSFKTRGHPMVITAAHITPLVALIAGILILILPRLLNYIVAIYLIIVGLTGLNAIHHFLQ
jgi:DUF3096 family protein